MIASPCLKQCAVCSSVFHLVDCVDCVGVISPLRVESSITGAPKFIFDEPKVSVKEAA